MIILSNNEFGKYLKKADEDALPYHLSSEYIDFTEKVLKKNCLVFYSDTLKALMPVCLFSVKTFKLLQVIYPPITMAGERLSSGNEATFLNDFISLIKKEKLAIRVTQSYSYSYFKAVPDNSKYCPFGTYIIDLENNSEDEIFSKVHPKHRNVIRSAAKQGTDIKWGDAVLNDFYVLYHSTMERAAMYCEPFQYFNEMARYMKNRVLCGVAYLEGKPQGALFIPYTMFGAFYLYGASAAKVEVTGALNLLHWEAIRILKERGVRRYDFAGARLSDISGTKLEGIQNFKKRFGGELARGYLWKIDINPISCKIFDNLLKINRLLKGGKKYEDIIDEERKKTSNMIIDGK